MTRSREKGENWATREAKLEAKQRNLPVGEVLAEMLDDARKAEDSDCVRDILQALKFVGSRNKRKRRSR